MLFIISFILPPLLLSAEPTNASALFTGLVLVASWEYCLAL